MVTRGWPEQPLHLSRLFLLARIYIFQGEQVGVRGSNPSSCI